MDPKKANPFPETRPGMLLKCIIFLLAQKACFRVRGDRRRLGLVSQRFSLRKVNGKPQVEGWAGPTGKGSWVWAAVAAEMPGQKHRELAKEGGAASQRRPSPAWHLWPSFSEEKNKYCFMMGRNFLGLIILDSSGQGSGCQLMLC